MALHVIHQQNQPIAINQQAPLPPSPNTHNSQSSHILGPPSQPVKVPSRKRKKTESFDEKPPRPEVSIASSSNGPPAAYASQPPTRRLRRLHEACARCRSKKIKCDSKLPSCSACSAANVECNQEDRHRQTLKPRGHADMVESQLAKCTLLLQTLIPGFKADDIDAALAQHGLVYIKPEDNSDMAMATLSPTAATSPSSNLHINPVGTSGPGAASLTRGDSAPAQPTSYESSSDNSSTTAVGGFPRAQSSSYADARSSPQSGAPAPIDVKGQDPQANDLSSTGGLIKAFGVSKSIVRDLKPEQGSEGEDVLGGVRMYSDPVIATYPKRGSQWTARPLKRRGFTVTPLGSSAPLSAVTAQSPSFVLAGGPRNLAFHLPGNRSMAEYICNCYFSRLNWHRPVYERSDFMTGLAALYDSLDAEDGMPTTAASFPMGTHGTPYVEDPGFLCCVYLVLALGTLSEMNHHLHHTEGTTDPIASGFPTHEEFFELALAVKPDLRVTISSLQALILLQWYLYTERHGRTLWRLVGNLVRLSIELGLHHDPSEQGSTFTPPECELRTRLWWIVMIHDRGTSVLLGRPLAIADADFNTPCPKRFGIGSPYSEHFDHSFPLTGIQGDIINALYRPGNHKQSGDQVLRHASRITKNLVGFRGMLPESYRAFFEGIPSSSEQDRIALVTNITEDPGLTMLKYGIARILLLRALFTSGQLSGEVRRRALKDAVITSHNILIVQSQLISYPSIAFFVSPIPIHIAAMVILYGVISECDALSYAKAKEDICIALHLVPLFRWRWNRKDSHGSHPLITKLAQKVFGNDVLNVSGPTGPPMLIPEWDWSEEHPAPGPMPPHPQGSHGGHHANSAGPSGSTRVPQVNAPMPSSTNGMYPVDQNRHQQPYANQVHSHNRHSSGMAGLPSATSSISGPGAAVIGGIVNGVGGTPPHAMGQLAANGTMVMQQTGGSAGGLPSPHGAISGFSPGSQQIHQADTPGSGGFQSIPIDDAERDVIVRFMYPPPLPDGPTNYFNDAAAHHQHVQHLPAAAAYPQQSGPHSAIHAPQPHHMQHHPQPHHPHSQHPAGPTVASQSHEDINQLFGTLQPVMYGDFNQSENYYVQEEYDVAMPTPAGATALPSGGLPSDIAMKSYGQGW